MLLFFRIFKSYSIGCITFLQWFKLMHLHATLLFGPRIWRKVAGCVLKLSLRIFSRRCGLGIPPPLFFCCCHSDMLAFVLAVVLGVCSCVCGGPVCASHHFSICSPCSVVCNVLPTLLFVINDNSQHRFSRLLSLKSIFFSCFKAHCT